MKYPGLTRVFSIIMAVMSIVLLFTGIYGMNGAITDRDNDEYRLNLLRQRVDTFEEYSDKLEGAEPYATVLKMYEEQKEVYDKLNAEHRTDLGIYSATQGGIKEGRKQLDEAKYALNEAANQIDAKIAEISDPNSDLYKQMVGMATQQAVAAIEAQREAGIAQIDAAIATGLMDEATAQAKKAQLNAQIDAMLASGQVEAQAAQQAQQMALAQIEAGKVQLSQGYESINSAEKQLKEKEAELQEEKDRLDKEKAELDEKLTVLTELEAKVEQIKLDEKKLTSTKIILESNEHIKASVDNGQELLKAAKDEIVRFTDEYMTNFKLKAAICSMLILAAVLGILEIPCAFEKIKLPWLRKLIPIAVVLLCIGAQLISMKMGNGNMYSAISAGIVALISSLFIIPDSKKTV